MVVARVDSREGDGRAGYVWSQWIDMVAMGRYGRGGYTVEPIDGWSRLVPGY